MSAGIDAVQDNKTYLLNLLLNSTLKPQEPAVKTAAGAAGDAPHSEELDAKGDNVDLLV